MEAVLDAELGVQRAMREIFTIFAVLTLLLGPVGIYSVVSYARWVFASPWAAPPVE